MLLEEDYLFLRLVLEKGEFFLPEQAVLLFADDFQPTHRQCHITAMQVAVEAGFPPVPGIAFFNVNEKLYPWPHMVNRRADGVLIDCSPRPDQPMLGFAESGWAAMTHWRRVTEAYDALGRHADAASWGDPLADALTRDFLPPLRELALVGISA